MPTRLVAVWITRAAITIAVPTGSFTDGGLPSAMLKSSADTGTRFRNAVAVTVPNVRAPWLKARIDTAEDTRPTYSSACHDTIRSSAPGALAQPNAVASTAPISSTGHDASTVNAVYSITSSSVNCAAPRVYQTKPRSAYRAR